MTKVEKKNMYKIFELSSKSKLYFFVMNLWSVFLAQFLKRFRFIENRFLHTVLVVRPDFPHEFGGTFCKKKANNLKITNVALVAMLQGFPRVTKGS